MAERKRQCSAKRTGSRLSGRPRAGPRALVLVLLLLLLLLLVLECVNQRRASALRSGKMRRRKVRKENSARFLFIQNSRRKEYYNSTNGAEIVKSSYFDIEYELGDKISLLCWAKGDPTPRVLWYKDGAELVAHQFTRIVEWKINATFVKSKLEIDPARQLDAGTYECHANNKYSVDRRVFKADF